MLRKIRDRLRRATADDVLSGDDEEVSRGLEVSAPAPELERLAAVRGAELVRAKGSFIESGGPDLPGTLISGLEMIGLTLEFAERPALYLTGHGHGEGLTSSAAEDLSWEYVETRDLSELEPFAAVIGMPLRQLTLMSYRGHSCHIGVRLEFEDAELVLLNAWDEIEIYDGPVSEVPAGRASERLYEYPYDGTR